MKAARIVTALACIYCLSPGCRAMADDTSAPPLDASAESNRAHDLEQSALFKQGLELAAKGDREAAIHDCYDPVIAYYERTHADSHKQYFSARSTAEALLYALEGAKTNTDTLVVSRNWLEAHFLKGFTLIDLRQLDAAHAEFDAALKLAPHNSQVRAELGSLYNRQGDFTKALETYQRAVDDAEFSPPEAKTLDRVHAYHGLGYAYTELHQWDEAEKAYRKSLDIDPKNTLSLKELSYIQQQRKAHPESVAQ
ncbi:MAG TPA: tetratricopeptide repeat protein [Steroidobacteraceae bacterium]